MRLSGKPSRVPGSGVGGERPNWGAAEQAWGCQLGLAQDKALRLVLSLALGLQGCHETFMNVFSWKSWMEISCQVHWGTFPVTAGFSYFLCWERCQIIGQRGACFQVGRLPTGDLCVLQTNPFP